MYDSVNVAGIPASAAMVAGYVDGNYANIPALRARFPHATVVEIAIAHTTRAQVLDVETGDATPAGAVLWCTQTMADTPNTELTVYCNSSTWPAVRAAFAAAGVSEPQYWIADYDHSAVIPAGAVAKQYTNTASYDISVVADHWPGVDPDPTPEADVPLTPADARTVWAYKNTASKTPDTEDMHQVLLDARAQATAAVAGVKALTAQLTAAQAAIATLAGKLGAEVDTDTVVAAVEKAIADALAADVVHVEVSGPSGS